MGCISLIQNGRSFSSSHFSAKSRSVVHLNVYFVPQDLLLNLSVDDSLYRGNVAVLGFLAQTLLAMCSVTVN